MVRVFRCHNFKSATVVPVPDEPLAVFADGDLVFVATRQCSIRIYRQSEEEAWSEWRCLSTICAVEKIIYNRYKDYIITLEQKRSWKIVSRYVRIYLNWQEEVSKTSKPRTKVRIAGKAHSLHSSGNYVPQLEVVEIPLDGTVTAIGVCKLTGNFAIGFGRELKLYQMVEKTVANSERTYRDVEPFLELCWNFDVRSVSLSEEFLVCCSHNEVQAITIAYAEADDASPRMCRVKSPVAFDRSGNSSRGEISSPRPPSTQGHRLMFNVDDVPVGSPGSEVDSHRSVSPASTGQLTSASTSTQLSFTPRITTPRAIIDDEYYQEWSFDPDDDLLNNVDDTPKNPASSRCKTVFLHSLHRGSPHARHHAAPPVLRDFRGGPVKSSSGVSAKTVLHLSDLHEQEDWLSVTLIPSHLPEQDHTQQSPLSWSGSNPVKSAFLPHRVSVCCFVSSRRGGYLYRLSPGSALVSSYRYTDVAQKVVAGPQLLQVVTKTGMETYTARWGAVALAATEDSEEVRPPSSLDICMCGIEPFFGAVDISHGTDVALLTKVEGHKGQDELHWNLYVLGNCSVADLYKDMVTFAARIQETGPSSYVHLLQEAHLLLRWEMKRTMTPDSTLLDLFQESCALLGDYYSWPRQDDWHLCLPYYQKSEMCVADVVRQAVQNKQHSKEQTSVYVYGRGLMAYLDWALFQSDVPVDLRQDISNAVLEIYTQTSPESLPSLLLLSHLHNYSAEVAHRLLTELVQLNESRGEQTNTLDRLAIVKVQLLLCDPQAAEVELSSLDKGELMEICTLHPEIIYTSATEFTPLGQLMRRHTPTTLLTVLAEIVGAGGITLEACLFLLENNCDVTRCRNNHVREFLEVLLNDIRRRLWFDEAASLLCKIYVERIVLELRAQPQQQVGSGPSRFHVPSGDGHFAARQSWLDYIPPINSPSALTVRCPHIAMATLSGYSLRTSSMPLAVHGGGGGGRKGGDGNVMCTCAFCLQDLLKLQSLLCSDHAGADLLKQVQGLVEQRKDMTDWDSVWILCSYRHQMKVVTEFVADKYPQVVAKFAVATYGRDLEKWQVLLRCLEERLRETTAPSGSGALQTALGSDQQTLLSAYKDVLAEMVELFGAEEFLMALPADGSLTFLLPFVTRSLQRRHLAQVKGHITSKGKELLTQFSTVC